MGAPPSPLIPKGQWARATPGFVQPPYPAPQALPRGAGAAVPAGWAEALAGGTGRQKDLLDLGHGGHFPSSGSGLTSNPLEFPSPFLPAFFPSGALFCP